MFTFFKICKVEALLLKTQWLSLDSRFRVICEKAKKGALQPHLLRKMIKKILLLSLQKLLSGQINLESTAVPAQMLLTQTKPRIVFSSKKVSAMLQQLIKHLLKVLLYIRIALLLHKKECKQVPLPLQRPEDTGLVVKLDSLALVLLATRVNSALFWVQRTSSKEVLWEQSTPQTVVLLTLKIPHNLLPKIEVALITHKIGNRHCEINLVITVQVPNATRRKINPHLSQFKTISSHKRM